MLPIILKEVSTWTIFSMQKHSKSLDVVSLQLPLHKDYQKNLTLLLTHIKTHQNKDIILAPEVCLTGFAYTQMQKASEFSLYAIEALQKEIKQQILILTVILEDKEGFINQAIVIHNHKIIHKQEKAKLFTLGEEKKYFKAGQVQDIKPFEIEGVSYALLICFELRFKTLWLQIEKADIIFIPARWGKPRKNQLEILSPALAVMNQCFVILSNASDKEMASSSAIISPFGNIIRNDKKESIEASIELQEIQKMRRYIVL
jgi:predicted amidohydrolase